MADQNTKKQAFEVCQETIDHLVSSPDLEIWDGEVLPTLTPLDGLTINENTILDMDV